MLLNYSVGEDFESPLDSKEIKPVSPKENSEYSLEGLMLKLQYFGCCCYCQVASVMSDFVRPHRQQPTRLSRPWDPPGKSTGMGCHCLLHTLATWCKELTHWKRPWCWEGLRAGREGGNRGWDESLSAFLSLEEDFLDKNLLTPFPCSLWSALYSSCSSHLFQQSPSAVLPLCWVLVLPLQVSKGDPTEKATPSPQTGQNWTFSEGTMPDCGEMWMNSPHQKALL